MKRLPIILFALLIIVGCSSKQIKKEQTAEPTKWEHFSGSWFEFDYPAYMQIDVERNEISDTIPGLKDGGDVYVYGDYLPFRIKLTKSCMFDVFDNPEKWRDLSIEAKEYGLSDDIATYLGVYDQVDSIDFKGNPAASVTFVVLENTDTVIHHQLVVMAKPSNNLYYLNVMAKKEVYNNYNDIVDSVFNSIVLK